MKYRRITMLCGHYGSGKTNIAVNMAFDLKKQFEKVAVADMDIVNPYFRTKDSSQDFKSNGIELIVSEFANSNVDLPSLPQQIYSITDMVDTHFIIDVGGDDRGALALGRISPKIIQENDYEMLMVINKYRPLTPDVESTIEVMREIEFACGIKFTGLVNNSNLGNETTCEDIINSINYAKQLEKETGLVLKCTTIKEDLYPLLVGKVENLFPIKLQKKII